MVACHCASWIQQINGKKNSGPPPQNAVPNSCWAVAARTLFGLLRHPVSAQQHQPTHPHDAAHQHRVKALHNIHLNFGNWFPETRLTRYHSTRGVFFPRFVGPIRLSYHTLFPSSNPIPRGYWWLLVRYPILAAAIIDSCCCTAAASSSSSSSANSVSISLRSAFLPIRPSILPVVDGTH